MKKPSSKSGSHNRFVPGEEIDSAQPWEFGTVTGVPLRGFRSPERNAAEAEAQRLRLQNERDAGYQQGLQEGQARAALEMRQQLDDFFERQGKLASERMAQCSQEFEARWAVAEQELAQGVLEIACALARQILRRELQHDPRALEPVICEAVALLGDEAQHAVVHLNPEDFGLLDAHLQQAFVSSHVIFRPDPQVPPGGCMVEGAGMSVDGSLQTRWNRALAALGMNSPWVEKNDVTCA